MAMDCNKDEAIRAKELSEKKMANNDFEGARNIALKAQKLYPELENITQLLSICDVHCSAQKRIMGSEKDWYAILQVQPLADDLTIKKQYRRLAFILHPDKNRLPGAEAAFKLISEANTILSDVKKKSLYDTKIRASALTKPPPHYVNRNFNVNQWSHSQNNVTNGFGNLNQHKAELFWTFCPFCKTKYQYEREHMNKTLCCKTCSKIFMACEISGQGVPQFGQPSAQVPSKAGLSQPAVFHEKVVLNQGFSKVGVQNGKGSSVSHAGSQEYASTKPDQPKPGIKIGSNLESNHAASSFSGNGDIKANGSFTNDKHSGNESTDLKKRRKRGRKMVVESSESFDISADSDLEDVTNEVNSGNFTANVNSQRRSSRRKQNISYNEIDDDDFVITTKVQKANENMDCEDSKLDSKKNFPANANCVKSTSKEKGTTHFEESLQEKHTKFDKEGKAGGETNSRPCNGTEPDKIESDSDLELDSGDDSPGKTYECPDTEFYDFGKERDAIPFKVDQIWACYDDSDFMPRFYAKVTKANYFPFHVSFKWLEAVPIKEAYDNWPVGCGTFKLGSKTEKTFARNMFSHQMTNFLPGKKRGSFIIYPIKGEIWAVLKKWDRDNNKEFKYEIVEVLSDFVDGVGIKVCYLDKINGFVSVFQKASQSESDSFLIGPDELYKFSHRVPSFKLVGCDGVPIGSFELDPASLPQNHDGLHFPVKAKKESGEMDRGEMDHGVDCSPPKSTGGNKHVKSESTNGIIDLDE